MSKNSPDVRFYKKKFPEPGDYVMVAVEKANDLGVHARLLEYNHIDGLIVHSNLRSTQKGKKEVVEVLSIDTETGYIELSKRRVDDDERHKCEDKFRKAKTADVILRYVSRKTNVSAAQLYEEIGWPLVERYGSLYAAFIISMKNDKVWQTLTFATPTLRSTLAAAVTTHLSRKCIKLRAELHVSCHGYGGIDAIKSALRAGEALGTEIVPIKVRLFAASTYTITSERCYDLLLGLETLSCAIKEIRTSIEGENGECYVKASPGVVSAEDEREFNRSLRESARKMEYVDGDEDVDALRERKRKSKSGWVKKGEVDDGVNIIFGED